MAKEAQNLLPPPFPLSDLGPCELSWSCQSIRFIVPKNCRVFWSRYNDELLRYHHQRPLLLAGNRYNGYPTMKETIRCALQGLGPIWTYQSYLIQFWGLVNIGDRRYLTTCDQPFALTHSLVSEKDMEGLCRYRKHCLEYLIAVDDETRVREGDLGPPGRVFHYGLPESISDVSHYSSQEYPQRDLAVKYLNSYCALPVYQSPGHNCVGVLEYVSTENDDFNAWTECRNSLEMAGLTTICLPIFDRDYIESSPCHAGEIDEIDNAMEEVCEMCQIPVAQTWIEANSEEQLLTIIAESGHGQCEKWFRSTSYSSFIRKGHGIVGKAFSSQSACFCRDTRKLSITEYALVPNARVYEFSSCFAICLQSSCLNSCIYTLEFFLPTNETNSEDPRTWLRKIMEILKQHLQRSFKVASGQELGQNLFVQVIKVSSDDELDSFEIYHTTSSESTPRVVEVQNQGGMTSPDSSFQRVYAANNSVHDINVQQNVIVGSLPTSELAQNIVSITHRQPIEELDAAIPMRNYTSVEQSSKELTNFKKRGSAYTLESELHITFEVLQQRSAMKLVDAAKDLGVSRSTLKRICRRHDIHRWPPHKVRKNNQAIDQQKFAQPSKKNIETHSMSVATKLQDDSSIMVKATYGDDIIKFQLSLSARKMDLDEKVATRLNLQVGSFKIKYQDEEDDWVLIPCDEDLSAFLNRLRSVGKTTIKMLVSH